MRILTILILCFSVVNLFCQDKTIQNFENAIEEGYTNSPTLIPISVINNNEKKYFLSDTETLYYAFETETNQTNSDTLKKIILENKFNQTFEFKNPKSLEIIGFNGRNSINSKNIKKINKYIDRKKILKGLQKLKNQIKYNNEAYNKYYKQRLIIRDRILTKNGFNNQEKKLIDYLATNITTDENKSSDFGNGLRLRILMKFLIFGIKKSHFIKFNILNCKVFKIN